MGVPARLKLVGPIVALCGVAACGTTVQLPVGASQPTGVASSDLSIPTSSPAGPGSTTPSASGQDGLGNLTPAASDPGDALPTELPSSAGGKRSDSPAPVFTDHSPISIGYLVSKDAGGAFKALGYGGLSTGDGTQEARASVKLINSQGGIAGHPIAPVIIAGDPTNTSAASYQHDCATMFQDHHVTAVISVLYNPILSTCAAKNHAAFLFASLGSSLSDRTLAAAPTTIITNMPTIDRYAAALTDALIKQGFFRSGVNAITKKPVVGLITIDNSSYAAAQSIVSKHLAAAGLTLKDTFKMPPGSESSDIARASAAGQAAALRFKAQGITHIVFVSGGFGASWFGVDARTESYYPRLGWSSAETPSLEPQVLSARQLVGSMGIGWSPTLDTIPRFQPTLGKHGADCIKALSKGGINMSIGATRAVAMPICDATFLLASPTITSAVTGLGLVAAIQQLGGSYASAMNFATDFRDRSASTGARAIAYKAPCDCFRYVGPVRPMA